jgi:hypothetical protein
METEQVIGLNPQSEKCEQNLVGKFQRERSVWRHKRIWEDSVKLNLR